MQQQHEQARQLSGQQTDQLSGQRMHSGACHLQASRRAAKLLLPLACKPPCTTYLLLLSRPASPDGCVQQGTLLASQRRSSRPNKDLQAHNTDTQEDKSNYVLSASHTIASQTQSAPSKSESHPEHAPCYARI